MDYVNQPSVTATESGLHWHPTGREWFDARPHPGLLSRGEGESFAGFWECRAAGDGRNVVEQTEDGRWRLPLLGERAGVREASKQIWRLGRTGYGLCRTATVSAGPIIRLIEATFPVSFHHDRESRH